MLTGVHFLLTYKCIFECDHCFLYSGPSAEGTFTIENVRQALRQMKNVVSINSAYFEGGEPFLYYPLLIESARLAKSMGFDVGIVSNAYWATTFEDALIWLAPLADIGVADLSISDDSFHHEGVDESPAKIALRAARKLGIPSDSICIEPTASSIGKMRSSAAPQAFALSGAEETAARWLLAAMSYSRDGQLINCLVIYPG